MSKIDLTTKDLAYIGEGTLMMTRAMGAADGWVSNGAGPVAYMHWLREKIKGLRLRVSDLELERLNAEETARMLEHHARDSQAATERAEAALDEANATIAKMAAALKAREWDSDNGEGDWYCSDCDGFDVEASDGHDPDCPLVELLRGHAEVKVKP